MSTPLISVIVPVYKVEMYLAKCVDSIVNQTYKNLEIILVDDGSPDNCGKICDDYAARDARVKIIHKENGGLSDARNAALDVMKGEYVTFIDSDDYVAEDFVEHLYEMVVETGSQILLTALNPFYENENPQSKMHSDFRIDKMDCDTALSQMFYQRRFDTCAQGKLYRADLLKSVRYPKGLLFEDLSTTYRIILNAKKVAFSDYCGYFYLLRKDSIEGGAFKLAKYESCIKVINQLFLDRGNMPFKTQKALKCRLVSLAFHVLVQIPKGQVEIRSVLFDFIKKNRCEVVFDFKARRKTQIAALLSYGGIRLVDLFTKYGLSR